MEILKIKIKSEKENSVLNDLISKNGFLFIILVIGISNIVLEFFFRRQFTGFLPDFLTEALHIVVYFIIPFVFTKKRLSLLNIISIILLFIFSSSLYFLINQKILSNYFYVLFPAVLILVIAYLIKEKKTANTLLIRIKNWKEILVYTILALTLSVGHLLFVLSLSHGFQLQRLSLPSLLPNVSYMLFAAFGMEVFFRGFIFRRLNSVYKILFWISAFITTVLYIGPFLANPFFTTNTVLLTTTVFYLFLLGFIFCALTKKTKSIIPSYILSIVMTIIRYFIIFGPI